jgi:hypothetical protein
VVYFVDDDSVLDSGNGLSGEVSVEFQHVEYTPRNNKPLLVKLSSGIVHERLKKGGGHAVQYVFLSLCLSLLSPHRPFFSSCTMLTAMLGTGLDPPPLLLA